MTQNRSGEFGEGGEQSLSLRHAMDRLFQDAFVTSVGAAEGGQFWPTLDILNTEDAFVVVASLPGVQPEDVEITLENQTLSIRADGRRERVGTGRVPVSRTQVRQVQSPASVRRSLGPRGYPPRGLSERAIIGSHPPE